MPVTNITQLQKHLTRTIRELEISGEPVVVFKSGKPVAVIRRWSVNDMLLANMKKGGKRHGKG